LIIKSVFSHPNERYIYLDVLRGISILLVLFSHYGLLGSIQKEHIDTFLYIGGTHGVAMFFILSGYFVAAIHSKKISILFFLIKRYWRIVPTFFLCAIIAFMFESYFFEYLESNRQSSLEDLIRNLIYIPTSYIPALWLGKDSFSFAQGVYWSLAIEFQYYVIFALLNFTVKNKTSLVITLNIISLMCLFIPASVVGDFLMWLPFFVFGATIFYVQNTKNTKNFYLLLPIVVFLCLIFFKELNPSEDLSKDGKLSYLLIFLLAYFVMFFGKTMRPNFLMRLIAFMGLISFPLYLLHQEFGMIMFKMFSEYNYYFVFVISVILVVSLSTIIHMLFERKFMSYSQKK
jgi:peptidoglycan/LPS O-acetylase OafA/YrhL